MATSKATSKISVIIAHEYFTRVKARWFVIATLLGPLAMALFVVIPAMVTMMAGDGSVGKVAIVDQTGIIAPLVVKSDTGRFIDKSALSQTQLNKLVESETLQAYVMIAPTILDSGSLVMYSRGGSGATFEGSVSRAIEPFIVQQRLLRVGTDTSVIRLVEAGVPMKSFKITEKGVETDTSTISAAIGYAGGFVIYILIFLYGSMVMRGVVDEKANRIIEVIASSARPFQIMVGKVVGIGLVGLTQLMLWMVLGGIVILSLSAILGVDAGAAAMASKGLPAGAPSPMMVGSVELPHISIWGILLFLFYFLCGYFIYASLFAALGSAVDQESDANQLTFPVTMPVVLTMMCIPNVVAAPNGMFAVILSQIPLFAPIVMTVRIASTDVPLWQIATSVLFCIGGFFGVLWLASRIYRIGILSYGRKPTIKEVFKWIFVKV